MYCDAAEPEDEGAIRLLLFGQGVGQVGVFDYGQFAVGDAEIAHLLKGASLGDRF